MSHVSSSVELLPTPIASHVAKYLQTMSVSSRKAKMVFASPGSRRYVVVLSRENGRTWLVAAFVELGIHQRASAAG
jgi:hypothetical protein